MGKRGMMLLGFLAALLAVPEAMALSLDEINLDFSTILAQIGEFIYEIGANDYAVFGITVIVLAILLKSIFAAALARVKIFEGSGGVGVSNPGSVVAWCLSFLSVAGMVWMKGERDVSGFLEDVLGPNRIFAAVFVAAVLFIWLRKAMGEHNRFALMITGLGCMAIAGMFNVQIMAPIGIIVAAIGLIKAFRGERMTFRKREKAEKKAEESERKLGRELEAEEKEVRMEELGEREIAAEERAGEALVTAQQREILIQENLIDGLLRERIQPDYAAREMRESLQREMRILADEESGEIKEEGSVKQLWELAKRKRQELEKRTRSIKGKEEVAEKASVVHEAEVKKELGELKTIHDEERAEEVKIQHMEGLAEDIRKRTRSMIKLIEGQKWEINAWGAAIDDQREGINALGAAGAHKHREYLKKIGEAIDRRKKLLKAQVNDMMRIDQLLKEAYQLVEAERKQLPVAEKEVSETMKEEQREGQPFMMGAGV